MNIIYFHVHDQGRYVQPYGYPVHTPCLQRLAEEGVLFRNAFCTAPSCSPSRASLLTGQYPHQCGMFGLTHQGWSLNDYTRHIRNSLSAQGFETVLAGTHHVTDFTPEGYERLGYGRVLIHENEDDLAELRTGAAIRFLREPHRKPFFLSLGYDITHHSKWNRSFVHSFELLGHLNDQYVRPIPGLPDNPATRQEAALQYRATEFQDIHLGRILDVLDELCLSADTIFLYTTDHGPGLPTAKLNLNDRGTGVSLVVRGPGGFSGGKVFDGLVSHLDVFPTLTDLLSIPTPSWLEGESLVPLVRGETDRIREEVYAEQNYHGRFLPLRSVRTERFRYIRQIGDCRLSLADYTGDEGEASKFFEEHGYAQLKMPEEQLYDTYFDPHEARNLVAEKTYDDALGEMRRKLDRWMERTDDPARNGTIPMPPELPDWAAASKKSKKEWGSVWAEWYDRLQNGE